MTRDSGQTGTGRQTEEIDRYVLAVREALADLPDDVRDELLEDLAAHLAEVAAEDPAPLADRLGPPAAYAAELRAAAGPAPAPPAARWHRFRAGRQRARDQAARLDLRVGRMVGYERFTDLAKHLAPAWWVLRGYLAAMVLVSLLGDGWVGLLPRIGDSTVVGLVVLAAFVAGSIWLAHRTPRLGQWPRRVLFVASGLLVLFGLIGLATMDENLRWGWSGEPTYVYSAVDGITDVFVVDENGRVLTDVRLFDQHGNPLDLGDSWCSETKEYDPLYEDFVVRYPRCWSDALPEWARGLSRQPTPTVAPTEAATPVPTADPEPTSIPAPAPTADPSPTPPAPTPGG